MVVEKEGGKKQRVEKKEGRRNEVSSTFPFLLELELIVCN